MYMHLLPASQFHHHNGIGGLFAHSLQVATARRKARQAEGLQPKGYAQRALSKFKTLAFRLLVGRFSA